MQIYEQNEKYVNKRENSACESRYQRLKAHHPSKSGSIQSSYMYLL